MTAELSEHKTNSETSNVASAGLDFFEAMGRSAVVTPVKGLVQMAEHLSGQKDQLQPPASNPSQSGGMDNFARKAGSAIGSALPFITVAFLTRGLLPASESRLVNFGAGAGLGFSYGALFDPVYGNSDNFWKSKLQDATVSALTVGTISSFGRSALGSPENPSWVLGRNAFTGLKSGIAGGIVNSEAGSLLTGHGLADPANLLQSTLAFGLSGAVLGGARGAAESYLGKSAPPENSQSKTVEPNSLNDRQNEVENRSETPLRKGSYQDVRQQFLQEIQQFSPTDQAQLRDALNVAVDAHDGQFRQEHLDNPGQVDPYIIHPLRTALFLMQEAGQKDPVAIKAAVLHDVVEDSDGRYTIQDIEKRFGPDVASVVGKVTKPASDGHLTAEQLAPYYSSLASAPQIAREVKLADRIDNIRDTLQLTDPSFQQRKLAETLNVYLPMAKATGPFYFDTLTKACEQLAAVLSKKAAPDTAQ